MRLRGLALVLVFAIGTAACGGAAATGPPAVDLGRDICVQCGMVIEDGRFVASYRLQDGTERLFDDVGGLILYGREAGELDGAAIWVADFETEEMVDARTAFFVPTASVASPMGHGLVAFKTEQAALGFAGAMDGTVLRWSAVHDLPVVDGLVGSHHEHDMADHDMTDHDMTDDIDSDS